MQTKNAPSRADGMPSGAAKKRAAKAAAANKALQGMRALALLGVEQEYAAAEDDLRSAAAALSSARDGAGAVSSFIPTGSKGLEKDVKRETSAAVPVPVPAPRLRAHRRHQRATGAWHGRIK